MVNSATVSIACSLWSAPKLAKRFECDEDGCCVFINGQSWIYSTKTGFTRSRERIGRNMPTGARPDD
jgi:hypothetical protein